MGIFFGQLKLKIMVSRAIPTNRSPFFITNKSFSSGVYSLSDKAVAAPWKYVSSCGMVEGNVCRAFGGTG